MGYIGNNLQAAFSTYKTIDDISGSFNGVTTSFALTVGGVAPVPAPLASNQCLISVGGVVQRPDDTGAEGFRLSGGNIVFSSAPNTGEDFFGVILAGADYVNVGVNFPSGSVSTPSITFDSDLDTGLYNPGANQLGFATAGTNRLTIDASGNINLDSNTLYVDAVNNRVGIGSNAPGGTLEVGAVSGAVTAGDLIVTTGSTTATVTVGRLSSTGSDNTTFRVRDRVNNDVFKVNPDSLVYSQPAGERARIDSSGRLLVGTSSSLTGGTAQYSKIQAIGNSANTAGNAVVAIGRGTAATSISSGNAIGSLFFTDNGAGEFASIECFADATPGASDYPGRLVFSTTADGASSPTERFRIRSDGNMGFFNTPGIYPNTDNAAGLGFSGFRWSSVYAANGTIQTSDQRAKTEITDASLGSDFVKALRPVSYKWIEGGKRDTGERDADGNYIYEPVSGQRTHWGFIAQEVKQAVDAAGVDFGGWVLTDKDDPDSQQALRYDQFIAPLTKALQEALAKIESLEARLTAAGI